MAIQVDISNATTPNLTSLCIAMPNHTIVLFCINGMYISEKIAYLRKNTHITRNFRDKYIDVTITDNDMQLIEDTISKAKLKDLIARTAK